MAAGAAVVVFYRQIADNMMGGASDYDKLKLIGVIAIAVGLLIALNLVSLLLNFVLGGLFHPMSQ